MRVALLVDNEEYFLLKQGEDYVIDVTHVLTLTAKTTKLIGELMDQKKQVKVMVTYTANSTASYDIRTI